MAIIDNYLFRMHSYAASRHHGQTFPGGNSGFALITILGICLIIMIIIAGISSQVILKIKMAQELENRSQAMLATRSGYAMVMHSILRSTFEPYNLKVYRDNGAFEYWNLYGQPFHLSDEITVTLRDMSGMVPVLQKDSGFEKLVFQLEPDSQKAVKFIDSLLDWQDADDLKRLNGAESWTYKTAGYHYEPRNAYIQLPQELKLLAGFDQNIYEKLIPSVTCIPTGNRNYLTMDRQTLEAYIKSKDLVATIMDLRQKNVLTPIMFRNMTGIQNDIFETLYPSNRLEVCIQATIEQAMATLCMVIEKKETETEPFQILEWRR